MNKKEIKLYTDGCARGNPGPAGAGFVITDMNGVIIETGYKFLGNNYTNNQAEYGALLIGLSKCLKICRGVVHVYSDSELLVKQMSGIYSVKNHELKLLMENVRSLSSGFEKVTFTHIKREKNSQADELANKAVDLKFKR
ncbi:MAG: ribonuclease HI family protein [Candidatus Lokiarchaeota archaeon]|nr:ribonuclease HI family protein [Candidatus Lokiarchaeota archaeon]